MRRSPVPAPLVAGFALAVVWWPLGELGAQDAPAGPASGQETPAESLAASATQSPVDLALSEIERLRIRIAEVEANLADASDPLAPLFEHQRRERWVEHHAAVTRLVAAIGAGGPEADSAAVELAREALQREIAAANAWVEEVRAEAMSAMESLLPGSPETFVEQEIELSRLHEGLDELLTALSEDYDFAVTLGLDLAAESAAHDSTVVQRAELLGASLEFSNRQIREMRGWLNRQGVDSASVGFRVAALEERLRGTTASLRRMAALLERRGLDTTEYRQLILTSSGMISTDVLDTRVLGGLLARWRGQFTEWLRGNGGSMLLRVLLIALIFLATIRLSALVRAGVRRGVGRLQISNLIKNLLVSGSGSILWIVAVFIVLGLVGFDLAPMLAGLGIVGIVVGFALQDTLGNFASGVMIMLYRPFDVGDFVTTAGVTGKVKDLTLVSTVVQTLDNKRIIIPNGKVWGDVINNATAERIRRVDLVFGIGYKDDIDHARAVLEDVLANDERVLAKPEPMVRVDSLGDSSVNLFCRPWCLTDDYWELRWHLIATVKKRFDAEGITIPFPQRDVHLHGQAGAAPSD